MLRTDEEVLELGKRYLSECTCKTQQEQFISQNDVRFTILSELEYFEPVTMLVVDPMHNLHLGITKHIVKLFKDNHLITDAHMREMQAQLNRIGGSRRYGRMRTKIEGNMANFTAAVNISSMYTANIVCVGVETFCVDVLTCSI